MHHSFEYQELCSLTGQDCAHIFQERDIPKLEGLGIFEGKLLLHRRCFIVKAASWQQYIRSLCFLISLVNLTTKKKTTSNPNKRDTKKSQEPRHNFPEEFSEGDETQNSREETDLSREKQRESCKLGTDLGKDYTI